MFSDIVLKVSKYGFTLSWFKSDCLKDSIFSGESPPTTLYLASLISVMPVPKLALLLTIASSSLRNFLTTACLLSASGSL